MAVIRAFKALRPRKDLCEKVVAPPYDVVSSQEAREIVRVNPLSFLRITKPEVDLPEGIDIYDDAVYKKGADNLLEFIQKGILVKDNEPHLYLYVQQMEDRVQHGIVGVFSCKEYRDGLIKKHENTREEKEIDRMKHIEVTNAQNGPVFLLYRNNNELSNIVHTVRLSSPVYDFMDNGIRHTFYIIRKDIEDQIIEHFKAIPYLYIADGHHRSAAAARVWEKRMRENPAHSGNEAYNFFLAVVFPHDELYIMDYNRVLKDLNGDSPHKFMENLKKNFNIEKVSEKGSPYKPVKMHEFGMYLDGVWYRLTAREQIINARSPVESLDVFILQEFVLDPLLGIKNPRKDKRIDFIGGIRGLGELENKVDKEGYRLAFAMYPTTIEQLMRVADAGLTMPPKSTWFEPKLKSGLFVHLLDE